MKDVASKDDITRLERAMNSRFGQMNSRCGQIQLLAVQLALAVVVILGLVAGALMLLPVNPSSAFGMVVSAFVKKNI
ncbi:hypothetical protein CHLRE_02g114550v5 [Chlamydomonas reinhardtii]|uniref:Uncharacterized protein n=1 Tax=Chlamydomonas reinhardtii TaxID=3055 RepID=A0A2K3E375_CHLRE|nr:uncharacterized protein CHLRE_02g114550v5 [Chlamydomonas reinhardtii]PNW87238.1 hypothetical protein CHLRE_02g114550v5 [Chlamydomonas reinhardtii]